MNHRTGWGDQSAGLHCLRDAAGCLHHRSPLRINGQCQICQLTDPFGTIIGLDGP
ncbi:MAG: hypothetical protein WCF33_22575 [Pseudonocardiaceae bacterium]